MLIIRVDDRLIHGQVIAGWVRPLGIDRLILASDNISKDQWMCKAYSLAVPSEVKLSIFSIKDTIKELKKDDNERRKTMVVIESIREVKRLVEGGIKVPKINLGCIGYSEGKIEITPYIYLSKKDIYLLKKMSKNGVAFEAQALPNAPALDISEAIDNLGKK